MLYCLSAEFVWAQVEVDGQPLELPEDIEGVLLLNIASYMGGVNLWASGAAAATAAPLDAPQSFCDGVLEARKLALWLNEAVQSHYPI